MRVILLLFALVTAPHLAIAQTATTGTVVGYVWTANNAPIADAAVQLRDVSGGSIAATTRTTANGEYRFDRVAPGRYVVESIIAVGEPFVLAAGETVATFVRVANALPVAVQDKSPRTISGHVAWSNDMTYENNTMTGGTIELGWPIGVGQWVVVETGFLRSRYPNASGDASTVSRALLSVAGRLGSLNRHGIFGQVGAGVWMQEFDANGIGGSRETGKFQSDDLVFTVGPGIGVDVPLGQRVSLVALVDVHLMPQRPRNRWVVVKAIAGATWRFGR